MATSTILFVRSTNKELDLRIKVSLHVVPSGKITRPPFYKKFLILATSFS
jgi:hypothetical protein